MVHEVRYHGFVEGHVCEQSSILAVSVLIKEIVFSKD